MTISLILKKAANLIALFSASTLTLPAVEAGIIYSGLVDSTIAHDSNSRIILNLGGAQDSFYFEDARGGFVLGHPSDFGSYWTITQPRQNLVGPEEGAVVDTNLQWARVTSEINVLGYDESHPQFGMGDFFDAQNKYMALRILDDDDALYGWVRMSHSFADEQLVIHDWAWNSVPGEPILAGEIPEPGTVALLAGFAALAAAGGRRILRERSVDAA